MRPALVVTAVAGVAVSGADAVVSAVFPQPPAVQGTVTHVAVGAAWIAAGLVASARRPDLRIGTLMAAVGFTWFATSAPWWDTAVPATAFYVLAGLTYAVGVHAVLAFPTGRLRGRADRIVVAGAYMAVLAGNLASALVWDPAACDELALARVGVALCGRNLLLVAPSAAVDRVVDAVLGTVGVALGATAVVLLLRRRRSASPAGRRVLGPVLSTAALAGALCVAHVALDAYGVTTGALATAVGWGAMVALGLVPVAFLVGLLRARLRRGAMTTLMLELAELPPAGRVRDALAGALGDPTLRLTFWLPERGGWAGLDGAPVAPPAAGDGQAVTLLDHDGERIAALEHDAFLSEDAELLQAVGAAARLAVENSRLQAQLRAQLEAVRASRSRIVAAGDAERRRIERDLHDGAQQRLLATRLALRLARTRVGPADAGDLEELLEEADGELAAGLDELRALARGIHPAVLTDEGLPAALAALARRATVPVEVRAGLERRLPAPVEAAAYFVVSEALANVAKHACASCVTVTVAEQAGRLRLEVADDGTGGADDHGGSGLRGLHDRVAALDGRLTVDSPPGSGTTLRADLPVPERAPHVASARCD